MTQRQAGGSMVALAASRFVFAASGLVVNLAMTRWLSREDFGVYRWMMAVTSIVAFGSTLGLGARLTRELVRSPERASTELLSTLRAVTASSGLTGLVVLAYVFARDGREEVMWTGLAAAVGLALLAQTQMVEAALHGMHETRREVWPILVGRSLLVVGNLGLLWAGFGIVAVMVGRGVASAVTLALLWAAWRAIDPPPAGALSPVSALWKEGRTFGATVFFGAVYAQIDILLLEAWSNDAEVARYGAPASVILQLALVSTVLTRGFFPAVAQAAADPAKVRSLVRAQDHALILVAAPVAVGGASLARDLAPALFGPGYADAATPLLILSLAVPLRFLHSGYGLTLTALDGQQERARIDRMAALLNVGMNLVAIPMVGALGAAATTWLTDLFLAWRTQGAVRARVGQDTGPAFDGPVRALLAATGMGLVLWVSPPWPALGRVGLGGLVYVVFAWATGALSASTLRSLRRV